MKKSILKSVVSVFAAATMLITSANLVLAENDYISYSNDFSSATGVTVSDNLNGNSAQRGDIVMAVNNGVLTSTRTAYDYQESEYRSNSAKATIALGKSFSAGKMQAKFDFSFTEGEKRSFGVVFEGYHPSKADSGVYFSKYDMSLLHATGTSTWLNYNNDASKWIQDGVTYTATITLDIATAKYTINVVNKSNPADARTKSAIYNWNGTSAGPITGISFCSFRASDKTTGVITFDNLSIDAYSHYNYEIGSVYKSANGLVTNKAADGFTFQGNTLSKLTNIANANATFITAGYESDGRMKDVVATPVSEIGSDLTIPTVEGDVVKSFILDKSNANPLMAVYTGETAPEKTVRKLDFESSNIALTEPYRNGYEANPIGNISTFGVLYNAQWAGVSYNTVKEGDNTVLKVDRFVFKESGTNKEWYYKNGAWGEVSSSQANNYFAIKLGEAAPSTKLTFKFKFADSGNTSNQRQAITVNMGTRDINIVQWNNGVGGGIDCGTDVVNWTDMKADEWYTFTGEITASGFSCSVAGNFDSGYAVKSGSNAQAGTSSSYILIGSNPTGQRFDWTDNTATTTTSVWYIDDVVVEY